MKNLIYFLKNLSVQNLFVYCILLLSFLTLYSCDTTESLTPDKLKPILSLQFEDASCTEAWIELQTKDLTLPADLTLKQFNQNGDSLSQAVVLNTQDSLLYIDSLLPNQTYKYQLSSIQQQISSNELIVVTMDTTSHNFTWQTWTFGGQAGSCTLYDVAIINENDIWAVGEIYMLDSLGNPDPNAYNAVHWDGNQWELLRIPYYYNGKTFYSSIRAIYAFNENDIWFGIASLIHWNGQSYQSINTISFFPALVNKMWGTSSNDFYIVGTNGQIAHYNGSPSADGWTKIESGTDLNIYDIWGDYNEKTQEWEILAVASNVYSSLDKEVIKISSTVAEKLDKNGIEEPLRSVWFKSNRKYYVVGSGTYEKTFLTDSIWRGDPRDITNYFENRIRANDINDMFIVGAYGEILHYNGYGWKSYIDETYMSSGTFLSVDIKNNITIAVGINSAKAIITVGHR